MITTSVNTPDGGTITVKHPEGASEESILAFAKQEYDRRQLTQQAEEQKEIETLATEGVKTEVGEKTSDEEVGFFDRVKEGVSNILPEEGRDLIEKFTDPVMSPLAGGMQELAETAAGAQQIVGEYGLADSPYSQWLMAQGGERISPFYRPPSFPPKIVADQQAEWDEQKAAATRIRQMEMAEELRAEVDTMQDTFGVVKNGKTQVLVCLLMLLDLLFLSFLQQVSLTP